MQATTRGWSATVLAIAALMMAFAGSNTAQEKKPYEIHDASALYNSLRDVINAGAKIFNDAGDHAGCYRMYQGSLLAVRPFLSPNLQRKIDDGLTKAEGLSTFGERAFQLRDVLDEVRTQVKPGGPMEKKFEDKKKDDKKFEDKKKDDKKFEDKKKDDKKFEDKKKDDKKFEDKKKDEDKKPDDKKKDDDKKPDDKKPDDVKPAKANGGVGEVSGKITLNGKAVEGGYFVTLVTADDKRFSVAINKGSFQFKTPIPAGECRIAIEPITGQKIAGPAVPGRYRAEATSGLSIRVREGPQTVDLNLVS